MSFFIVLSAPIHSESLTIALKTCRAIIQQSQTITRIFIHSGAIELGTKTNSSAAYSNVEACLISKWQSFINDHNIDAAICSDSANRAGIKSNHQLLTGYSLGGLALLSEAVMNNSTILTFGDSTLKSSVGESTALAITIATQRKEAKFESKRAKNE